MVGRDRARVFMALTAGAVVVASLSGCASSGSRVEAASVASDVTLAQSKSYAQLLRNEASSRLPAIVLKEVSESTDVSVACDEARDDPEQLLRSWRSATRILITNSTAPRVQTVADDLVDTFVAQGWIASDEPESTADLSIIGLGREASLASIEIAAASKAADQAPSITITTTGACALTDGPESDEVVTLEGGDPAA
jgi:hypothetical protein